MRKPQLDEMPAMLELISHFMFERRASMDDLNVEELQIMLEVAHQPDSPVYVAITEDRGTFTGIIVGLLGPAWFAAHSSAHIATLYVRPDYRGSSAAVKLIKGFENWAKKHHIKDIRFEVDSGIDAERTYKFVERLGYHEAGRIFEREA